MQSGILSTESGKYFGWTFVLGLVSSRGIGLPGLTWVALTPAWCLGNCLRVIDHADRLELVLSKIVT